MNEKFIREGFNQSVKNLNSSKHYALHTINVFGTWMNTFFFLIYILRYECEWVQAYLFYCTCFILLLRYYILFLKKCRIYGNLASSKSSSTIFPTIFVQFVSLYHILIILTTFQTFWLLLYFYNDLWSVIIYVTTVVIWGHWEPQLCKIANIINKCVFWLLQWPAVPPSLSSSLGFPISWDASI